MRLFVFTFGEMEATTDFHDGLSIQPAFAVTAFTLDDAVRKLAAHNPFDGSEDPQDYHADIASGVISVSLPTVL